MTKKTRFIVKRMLNKTLNISTSPHIVKGIGTDDIMRNVVWALLPVAAFAVYSFGLSALAVLLTTTAACVLTEHFLSKKSKSGSTVSDWSAVITGLLLGLTLPPNFPVWMAFAGGVIAIAVVLVERSTLTQPLSGRGNAFPVFGSAGPHRGKHLGAAGSGVVDAPGRRSPHDGAIVELLVAPTPGS